MLIPVLYAISIAVLLMYGLNLLWLAHGFVRHDRVHEADDEIDGLDFPVPVPIVTVQLPLYNERYVVDRLIDACAQLDYPLHKLEIQVLDDSTDETVALVAGRVEYWRNHGRDVVHIRRSDRSGFKAGALERGLAISRGEFVAIFDADFVPPQGFLKSTLPQFNDPQIGMVQARWSYLNRASSFLTRLQALSLDAHFAVEQFVRNRVGCFINFNGTAGIWRRSCIVDAGGWQGDTLTEDLDLSYRAQLRGWKFKFLPSVEAPSELPIDMNALRTQQFRWTKGSIQTVKKIARDLVRKGQDTKSIVEGLIHLTSHMVFPFVILAALLHAPLVYMKSSGAAPVELYFAAMSLGLFALAGVFLVQLFAQRSLYPDWVERMRFFPMFIAGSLGLSINNTLAIADALIGRESPFVRTPKLNSSSDGADARRWWQSAYARVNVPTVAVLEIVMAAYCLGGLVVVISLGEWVAAPFQALFTAGFGLVGIYNVYQVADAR